MKLGKFSNSLKSKGIKQQSIKRLLAGSEGVMAAGLAHLPL